MPVTGPDFISLQTRDLDASQAFYETYLGLVRSQAGPPHAVVFDTQPTFAVRDPAPGVDLESGQLGLGVALWLHDPEAVALHQTVAESGVTILQELFEGPFGMTFVFQDPDGYAVTVHDRAARS